MIKFSNWRRIKNVCYDKKSKSGHLIEIFKSAEIKTEY